MDQENEDFLWLGGADGLARYAGCSIVTLRHNPADPSTLPNSTIITLTLDKQGLIWAGQSGGYVSRINPITFEVWHSRIKGAEETTATRIFCDSQGTIWCGIYGLGL